MSPRYSVSKLIHRAGNLAYRVEQSLVPLVPKALRRSIVARPLDLPTGIDLIRQTPLPRLREPDFIENELLPPLGLNDELLYQQPASLTKHLGQGLDGGFDSTQINFQNILHFYRPLRPHPAPTLRSVANSAGHSCSQ